MKSILVKYRFSVATSVLVLLIYWIEVKAVAYTFSKNPADGILTSFLESIELLYYILLFTNLIAAVLLVLSAMIVKKKVFVDNVLAVVFTLLVYTAAVIMIYKY